MKILIVDDDKISRELLKKLLSERGDCECAADGPEALTMVKAAIEKDAPYTLITMDVDMPTMTGQEVVSAIRAIEEEKRMYESNREAKILMVTIMDDAKDIVKSFRQGCEWYLVKPVTKESLSASLKEVGIE